MGIFMKCRSSHSPESKVYRMRSACQVDEKDSGNHVTYRDKGAEGSGESCRVRAPQVGRLESEFLRQNMKHIFELFLRSREGFISGLWLLWVKSNCMVQSVHGSKVRGSQQESHARSSSKS